MALGELIIKPSHETVSLPDFSVEDQVGTLIFYVGLMFSPPLSLPVLLSRKGAFSIKYKLSYGRRLVLA